jgi:two-component system, NarL family, sensor kinase
MAEWQDPKYFALALAVVLLFVFILVSSMVLLTRLYIKRIVKEQEELSKAKEEYQKSLLLNSVLAQEKERERIASDLHDVLISKLTVITYAIQTENPQIKPVELLKESINIARGITHDLRPPLLDQTPLHELIEDFITPIETAYTINCFWGHWKEPYLESEIKLQLFRIVQESVNNIIKHAKATRIDIKLRITDQIIALYVHDNGVGFNPSQQAKGLGLKNIEIRSQLLKGKSRFKSNPNRGTTFQFNLINPSNIHLS